MSDSPFPSPFRRATQHFRSAPTTAETEAAYRMRTRRNLYWVGEEAGQKSIRDLKIAIAGLGGMGSNIAEVLARAGVGHLRIADPDTIDVSNINRQVIANYATVGQKKAAASAHELRLIAPEMELVVYDQGVEESMVDEFVAGCDAVVNEIDVFPLDRHVLLHRSARKHGLPVYTSLAVGLGIHFYKFSGEAFTFEHFLAAGKGPYENPSAEFLVDTFGYPLPRYLGGESGRAGFIAEIAARGAPIFGPTVLLGHSLLGTRLLVDLIGARMPGPAILPTPMMPDFLKLDVRDLTFEKIRYRSE